MMQSADVRHEINQFLLKKNNKYTNKSIPLVDDSKSAYLFRGIKYTYSVQRTLTSTIYIG
jgi:hypothetical protein